MSLLELMAIILFETKRNEMRREKDREQSKNGRRINNTFKTHKMGKKHEK